MAFVTRSRRSALRRQFWSWGVTLGSVAFCLLILPTRLPGMELLGVSPNWLLIWIVAWSVSRSAFESAIAGLVLGVIQDSLTASYPTHALGLMIAGLLAGRLQQRHNLQGDIISIALIVFAMAIVAETAMALQFTLQHLFLSGSPYSSLSQIWVYHQKVALSSAILSSLWAPALYYPLKLWWERDRP